MNVKSRLRDLRHGNIKFIEGDDKVRAGKCLSEIKESLKRYDCIMLPEFLISGNNIQNRVKITAKPRNKIIQPNQK